MKREDRAKQFLPFDAMKGLAEAMRRQEERLARVEKIELGDEDAAALSATLSRLKRGDDVEATFYDGGRYRTIRGRVTALDEAKRTLTMADRVVLFDDLVAMTLIASAD